MAFVIRAARPEDAPAFVALVRGLAEFEKLTPPDAAACARLAVDGFGPNRKFELLVAEQAGVVVAYALHFFTYSTFRALPSLFLEDLFVHPDHRGAGIGRALMHALARVATERGCGRFEWTVLDWNQGAQRFYASLGASVLDAWRVCRLDGAALSRLASAR